MVIQDGVIPCNHCGARNRLKTPPAGQVPVCGKCRNPLPWTTVASEASFGNEISASVPVLVDFWAEWCGPCRAVAPVLEELAIEMAGKLKVVKLNVDENPAVAQHYGIRSIPTLMLFKGGQAVDTVVGAMPKPALLQRLAPHLAF